MMVNADMDMGKGKNFTDGGSVKLYNYYGNEYVRY